MKLPIEFNDLGATVTVRTGETDGELGYFSIGESGAEIVLRSDLDGLGQVTILIHEALHAAELAALDQGVLKEEIPHDFISGASFALGVMLARCSALEGIDPESVDAEIERMTGDE